MPRMSWTMRRSVPVSGGRADDPRADDPHADRAAIGLVGANGSNSPTLARLVNGLVTPSSGRVWSTGRRGADGAAVRRRVGFCFTDPAAQLVMPTCVEDVELSLRRSVRDAKRRVVVRRSRCSTAGLAAQAWLSAQPVRWPATAARTRRVLATDPRSSSPTGHDAPRPRQHPAGGRGTPRLPQQLVLVTRPGPGPPLRPGPSWSKRAWVRFDGPADAAIADYLSTVPSPRGRR